MLQDDFSDQSGDDLDNIGPGEPKSVVESANGTLVIIVCRGKHLPNRRKLDKQSPYVSLRLGTIAKKTSAHFRAGQTPEWTQEIRFELERDKKPILKVDVLDETKGEPTPIGSVEIDCAVLFAEERCQDGKYIFDQWHELMLNGKRAGMIYLEMTFYPSSPLLPPKLPAKTSGSYSVGSTSVSPRKQLPAPPVHPSQLRPKTVADDIFVTSEYEKSRKHSFFGSPSPKELTTSTTSDPLEEKSPKKAGRFAKLKSKFQSKEPISQFWDLPKKRAGLPKRRSDSPISEYGFDDEIEPYPAMGLYNDEDIPPPPPPHSVCDMPPPTPPHSTHGQTPSYNQNLSVSPDRRPRSPQRKPPQTIDLHPPNHSPNHTTETTLKGTALPFSADTIGIEDDDEPLPTKVFLLGEQIKSLSHSGNHTEHKAADPNHIDPKYYAPTPSEHLATTLRLQNGGVKKEDVAVDLRTDETGYLGDGKWKQRFSPSVFDRAMEHDENLGFEHKPRVPPKIPRGMSEMEYYVLEKEKFLKDLNGRRA
ncbi:hypothetical protein QFC19_005267 [Naganishia cerealis]|uniref:Uncharacterized protein n=1 Tax=Naganishia cerealis TaxID=610337 RepID=A0ACC2VS74_9TREE|nr:hypothetical protein QFC19_005267 [Naganishia cerealis]